jgi:hypothetical protein
MGVVDELVAANHLGAYGRFLDLLKKPEERQRFIANNGEETLVQLEEGVRNGMAHAILESQIFVRRIFQINSNLASQAFVSQALASGQLTEQEPLVQSFRSVEADSLYGQIAQATAPIRQAIQASGQEPQIFWFQWLQNAQQSLVQLPEFQRARAYVPSAIAYPF